MDLPENILQNITSLTKFEPMSPGKIYYINCLTPFNTLIELNKLVKEKRQFIIQTKYDYENGCPKCIQISFAHHFQSHILLVETLYLSDFDVCLHYQMRTLFSIILSPHNEIKSWNDIKLDLSYFLDCFVFSERQIEEMNATNIQHEFQTWFRERFTDVKLKYAPSKNNWTLEMAIAFAYQQYFDTSLSKALDWNIGLFAHFETDCSPEFINSSPGIFDLLTDNNRRSILIRYAVDECMAVAKIAVLLLNNRTRKNGEKYLKKYYHNS